MIQQVPKWYHRVEVAPGIVTPGIRDTERMLEALRLPEDCRGLRVLDLGARDGFFSLLLEQRGAEVVALDHVAPERTGFWVLRELFNSKVTWRTDNVYNVSPETYGRFDIVLCLGLLYHLRNPLRALEIIREVCTGELYVESFVIDSAVVMPDGRVRALAEVAPDLLSVPIMQFYPTNELNNDYTNWWGPNVACLRAMLESTNFSVRSQELLGSRAIFRCSINEDQHIQRFRNIERGLA